MLNKSRSVMSREREHDSRSFTVERGSAIERIGKAVAYAIAVLIFLSPKKS